MDQEKHYRHELKFAIRYPDYVAMRSRLRQVMTADPHAGPDGRYHIRSIYFDNCDDKALKEKNDGIKKREKFRIRYYNDDFSRISLEKKMTVMLRNYGTQDGEIYKPDSMEMGGSSSKRRPRQQ